MVMVGWSSRARRQREADREHRRLHRTWWERATPEERAAWEAQVAESERATNRIMLWVALGLGLYFLGLLCVIFPGAFGP